MKASRALLATFLIGAAVGPVSLQADDEMGDKLGTVRFAVSGRPDAHTHVVRGVKLLHHMMYPQADAEFAAPSPPTPRARSRGGAAP